MFVDCDWFGEISTDTYHTFTPYHPLPFSPSIRVDVAVKFDPKTLTACNHYTVYTNPDVPFDIRRRIVSVFIIGITCIHINI